MRNNQFVLPQTYACLHTTRRVTLRVEAEVSNAVAHQALRVGLIVNRERLWVANVFGLGAQNTNARRVKRADPHLFCHGANKCLYTLSHFLGGLVGKGDRQNIHWVRSLRYEMRDALRQYPSFARARAGNNQQRPTWMHYCIALVWVKGSQVYGCWRLRMRH